MSQADLPRRLGAGARRLQQQGRPVTASALAVAAGVSRSTLYRQAPTRRSLERLLASQGVRLGSGEARILAAAGRVLERRGLRGATFEAIAEEAGLGVATLYRRYRDREALWRRFVAALPSRGLVQTLRVDGRTQVAADLEGVAEAALGGLASWSGLVRAVLGSPPEAAPLLAHLRDRERAASAHLERYLRACMERGLLPRRSPRTLARHFYALVLGWGVVVPTLWGPARSQVAPTARELVRQFLEGAGGGRQAARVE
jgi:AcrR family transcriptional regulator